VARAGGQGGEHHGWSNVAKGGDCKKEATSGEAVGWDVAWFPNDFHLGSNKGASRETVAGQVRSSGFAAIVGNAGGREKGGKGPSREEAVGLFGHH